MEYSLNWAGGEDSIVLQNVCKRLFMKVHDWFIKFSGSFVISADE